MDDKQLNKIKEDGQGSVAEERRPVPQVQGKNYYTNHIIRRMTLKLEHIRPKKAA